VTDFTSSIESMRITRDNKNAEIERFQNEIKVRHIQFYLILDLDLPVIPGATDNTHTRFRFTSDSRGY
jgi:hypothetical protein